MRELDLERIRHAANEAAKFVVDSLGTRVLSQDVPALIAEIERLRASLHGHISDYNDAIDQWGDERERILASLKAELAGTDGGFYDGISSAISIVAAAYHLQASTTCTCPDVDTTPLDREPGSQTTKGLDPACPEHGTEVVADG